MDYLEKAVWEPELRGGNDSLTLNPEDLAWKTAQYYVIKHLKTKCPKKQFGNQFPSLFLITVTICLFVLIVVIANVFCLAVF